ncbi:MAG: alpha-glucan family phosphorylase [Acidobacteriota bacterium]
MTVFTSSSSTSHVPLLSPSAIPTRHVCEIELPREYDRLYELAYNLWWSWTPAARDLFGAVDRSKWAHYRNPVELLINIDPKHWYELHEDDSFRSLYNDVVQEFDAYLHATGGTWFEHHHGTYDAGPVAYFSMEYGLHQSLQIYSGGLGVLSGDHCKSASDLGLPFVGVGLLYRRGYFMQTIDAEGYQQHIYPEFDFTRLPLRPIATSSGQELRVKVELPGRTLEVLLWLAQVGRVPLILLDTDLPENDPADRPITNQLYVRGREMRILQEIVLGVGGVKALRALGVEPGVWHLNEGHSAFLQLERVLERVKAGSTPHGALEALRPDSVFTTHTPVPAGNETFDRSLVTKYFEAWCDEVGMPVDELLELGRGHEGDSQFNLTAFALRTSSWANGVSQLNAEVASEMWHHLLPAGNGQPIHAVTNGVHARTWLGPEMQRLLRRHVDEDWEAKLHQPQAWRAVLEVEDRRIWSTHLEQKERLGRFTRSRLQEQFARHGASPDELRAVGGSYDPEALTIGFARRFATYKRASLVFSDLQRLEAILTDDERPVQLIFAGKAHPADRPGQQLIQRIFELSRSEALAGRVFILENYDMRMGRMLVQGVDVWLNTPRRPMEASGTSGQKVGMNGGLNFSIADGWWPEGFDGNNGWVIDAGNGGVDDAEQDRRDAAALYDILEHQILPLYYQRDEQGLPRGWIARMKDAMATITPQFSASRMVAEYADRAYVPAARRGQERDA